MPNNYGSYSSRHPLSSASYPTIEPRRDPPVSRPQPQPRPRMRDALAEGLIEAGVQSLFESRTVNRHMSRAERALREAHASHEDARRNGVSFGLGGGTLNLRADEGRGSLNASYREGGEHARLSLSADSTTLHTSTLSRHHRDRQRVQYISSPTQDSVSYSNHRTHLRPRDGHSNFNASLSSGRAGTTLSADTDERYGSRSLHRDLSYRQRQRSESLSAGESSSDDEGGGHTVAFSGHRTRR